MEKEMIEATAAEKQQLITSEFGVKETIDVSVELNRRVRFLADYLQASNCESFVLGISGGIDSAVAGGLAKLAVGLLNVAKPKEQPPYRFIAVRLPYGDQADEIDAQLVLRTILPDEIITVNIHDATTSMLRDTFGPQPADSITKEMDFVQGNIKARQRMTAQYAIAGANKGLVIGTDHAAEAVMGFFTKFGDGACDITPLTGLNKRQVRQLGTELGIPSNIVNKVPTADLEDLKPGLPDEVAYGVTYDEIDDYLEGRPISEVSAQKIWDQYKKTGHKRSLPVMPGWVW